MGGQSPVADLQTGGADYIFTRIKGRYRNVSNEPNGFFWTPKVLRRTDAISYDSDCYGRVTTDQFIRENRQNTIQELQRTAGRAGNETIVKRTLSIFDDLDHIKVDSLGEQERIIKVFRDAGFTKWPDGRSFEQVIKHK